MEGIDWWPYEKRYWYPHMMPGDVAIWEKFIANNPKAFDKVSYDLAVGQGASFDPTVNDETGGDINRLYQRKIDVLAVSDKRVFVIEIKPRAGSSSLGQVRAYVTLFKRDYSPVDPVTPMVLTDMIMPDMEFLAKEEKVELVQA